MNDNKKHNQVGGGVNPVAAAVAGAVVAGVAVAGAMALSSTEIQDKVKNVVTDVKANFQEGKTAVLDKAQKVEGIVKNAADEVQNV